MPHGIRLGHMKADDVRFWHLERWKWERVVWTVSVLSAISLDSIATRFFESIAISLVQPCSLIIRMTHTVWE